METLFSLHDSGLIGSATAADGMQRVFYPLGCFKASSDVASSRDLFPPRLSWVRSCPTMVRGRGWEERTALMVQWHLSYSGTSILATTSSKTTSDAAGL